MQDMNKNASSGFVAGTLVHTDKGLILIQDLQVGDLVLTSDRIGFTEYQSIKQIFKYDNQEISEIILKAWVEPSENQEVFDGKNVVEILYYGETTNIFIISEKAKGWKNSTIKFGDEAYYIKPKYPLQENPYIINIEQLYTWEKFAVGLEVDEFPYLKFTLFEKDNYSTMIVNEPNYSSYDDDSFELDNHFRNFDDTSEDTKIVDEFRERTKVLQEPVYQTLYQLEVEKTHTYFIGENGLWVGDVTILPTQ